MSARLRSLGGRCAAPLLVALLSAVASGPAPAETAVDPPPAEAAPPQAAARPEAEAPLAASEPDPLTPKPVAAAPVAAPGAPLAAPARARAGEPDAIVAAVRRELGSADAIPETTAEARDRRALAAFYADGDGRALWTGRDGLTPRGRAVIAELERAADWGLDPAAFSVPRELAPAASPEVTAQAEIEIGLAVLKYARHARGGRIEPSNLSRAIDRRPQLYEPGTVLAAIAAAAEADAYLRDLHPRHAGFRNLQKALAAARADASARPDAIQRILVNMERWRWLPDDLGEFHIVDNVPEQMTRAYRDGRIVFEERIVVGKPTQQTPEFSAALKFVIFHPSWGVPDGIKTNEIGPMLRRAAARSGPGDWLFGGGESVVSRTLARHELVVMHNGRRVNPDAVDWTRVDVRQFQFTQPPSNRNVLGVVKFRFPNKFDVYMHDTQDKHLFSHNVRAYSHGCMRVQNPMRLAEVILAYDKGWSGERVRSFVGRGQTSDVTIDKNIPVHIVYFTAVADEDGKLRTFPDLYGRDARLASALAGKPVAVASASPPAAEKPERSAGARSARRPMQRQQAAQPAPRPAEPFNPFAAISSN